MKFKTMRSMISVGFLSIAATVVAVGIQVPAQAAKLTGSFDWDIDKEIPHNSENKLINFMGEATFMIDKHSRTGMITFSDLKIDNNLLPLPNRDFDIISDSIMFGEEWKLEMFEFKNNIAEGTIDLVTKKASFNFIPENPHIPTPPVTLQNVTIKHTPEPTSTLAFLTLGTVGAASTLKHKLKLSKSADKELEKV